MAATDTRSAVPAAVASDTRLARRPEGLAKAAALTFATSASILVVNAATGTLVARLLGPDGRGQLSAVLAAVSVLSWVFAMGCRQAVTYHHSRRPEDAPALLSSWLLMLLLLGLVAILVGEVVLPHLLAAQSTQTLELARLYMATVVFLFAGELFYGVLLADRDFRLYNILRLGQPTAVVGGYLVLWATGLFSVRTALLATFLPTVADNGIVAWRVLRRHRLARPRPGLAVRTLWYGARAHGTTVSGVVNARLDLVIIPAFLSASSVGLYAVATSVSWIVVAVAGSLSALVLPVAAGLGRDGARTVVRSLHATFAVALAIAIPLWIAAPFAVPIVYGSSFAGSVAPLQLLLIGSVLYAGASVLASGLYALGRPLTAAAAQLSGVVVTVTGLVVFLEHGGIRAAALVSTVAYAVVFVVALTLYLRASRLTWSELLPSPTGVRGWCRDAARSVYARG